MLTESTLSAHEPLAPRMLARSVIRPSRPITLLTRPSSRVRPSRLSASWLNAFATSPIAPVCSLRRTFGSPSLAWRRASTSSFRSFFEISTVPLAGFRPFVWPALRADLLLRVCLSGATATVGSFVRGMRVHRWTVWATRLPACKEALSPPKPEILLARVKRSSPPPGPVPDRPRALRPAREAPTRRGRRKVVRALPARPSGS